MCYLYVTRYWICNIMGPFFWNGLGGLVTW